MERDRARCKDGNGEERSGQGHAFQVGEKERERLGERVQRSRQKDREKGGERERERERKERTEN